MKKIIGILFFSLVCAVMSASAQKDYCFENNGLKVKQIVSMTITGNKIEGTMESGGYETENMETFDFTGIRAGRVLTIKFAGKPPYERTPGSKKIVWTLNLATLRVPMYGKNYDTGKYSTYNADFQKCTGK